MSHSFDHLNKRLTKLLESLELDPLRSGEITRDMEFDPQGLKVHDAKLKRSAEVVKLSEQLRKNVETEAKLEVMQGQYIHEKEFEEIVASFYRVVEEGILKSSDPQEQLKYIREGLGEFV